MKYEQQIDKYLLGQMSPMEETSFLEKCKTNKELREEATMMALLVKAIKNLSSLSAGSFHLTSITSYIGALLSSEPLEEDVVVCRQPWMVHPA